MGLEGVAALSLEAVDEARRLDIPAASFLEVFFRAAVWVESVWDGEKARFTVFKEAGAAARLGGEYGASFAASSGAPGPAVRQAVEMASALERDPKGSIPPPEALAWSSKPSTPPKLSLEALKRWVGGVSQKIIASKLTKELRVRVGVISWALWRECGFWTAFTSIRFQLTADMGGVGAVALVGFDLEKSESLASAVAEEVSACPKEGDAPQSVSSGPFPLLLKHQPASLVAQAAVEHGGSRSLSMFHTLSHLPGLSADHEGVPVVAGDVVKGGRLEKVWRMPRLRRTLFDPPREGWFGLEMLPSAGLSMEVARPTLLVCKLVPGRDGWMKGEGCLWRGGGPVGGRIRFWLMGGPELLARRVVAVGEPPGWVESQMGPVLARPLKVAPVAVRFLDTVV